MHSLQYVLHLSMSATREKSDMNTALIETRGTGEPQGPSNSFKTMDAAIIAQLAGGTEVCAL